MLSITIATDKDLTPKGKRAARYVRTYRGGTQLRLYVAGRVFVKGANPAIVKEWLAGENGPNHCPQDWANF